MQDYMPFSLAFAVAFFAKGAQKRLATEWLRSSGGMPP
jgi:hypothetical protein